MVFDYELMFVNDQNGTQKNVTSGVLGSVVDLRAKGQGKGFDARIAIAFSSDTTATANNAITVKDDGLHVDVSGKIDDVEDATADNLPALDANGKLTDSGIAKGQVVQKSDIATTAEVTEMLNEVFGITA